MSSETKYVNSNYEDFFEKSLSKYNPELFEDINDELISVGISMIEIIFY